MKIATWNVNECVGITCSIENKAAETFDYANADEIIETLKECDFDVICFQEYPVLINGNLELTERIVNETGLKYYETYDTYDSWQFKGGRVGVAVFSKYEIKESYKTLFANPNMVKTGSNGVVYQSVDKAIIKIVVSVDDEDYAIITGHAIAFAPYGKTEFDYPESYKPLEELMMSSKEANIIALGDFNSEKIFEIMPSIASRFTDVVETTTTKDYYEKTGEIQRDYILISGGLDCDSKTKRDNYSDHYIICASIEKKKEMTR